jgi:CheY-like chemotaxis protein
MRVLIVEDEPELGQLVGRMLEAIDRFHHKAIERVTVANNLEAALELIPQSDAVLCDGRFPVREQGTPDENWAIVADRAMSVKIPCVIYTGNADVVDWCAEFGFPVLAKPASAEAIYAALISRPLASDIVRRVGRRVPLAA